MWKKAENLPRFDGSHFSWDVLSVDKFLFGKWGQICVPTIVSSVESDSRLARWRLQPAQSFTFLYGTNRAAFAQAPCTATTFKRSESIVKESAVVVDNNQILYKSQQHFRLNFKRDERLRALCRFVHDCMSSNRFQDVRQETSSEHVAVDILAKVHRSRWSFSCVFTEFDDVNWNQRIITIRAGLLGAV